jgi:RNA polymerase sigma-70 factor (ECF subfamily)
MSSDESLDLWIQRLNEGDLDAAERVFTAYEPYLRMAVRRRISRKLRSKVDSKDVVQSVFADFLGGFRHGGWRFEGRPQVLSFLRRIAWRRLSDHARKHRPSLDRDQPLDAMPMQSLPQTNLPRPSEVAQGRELWERMLDSCPPAHREIVRLRYNGLKLAEIAERTGLHEGSVRRILYDLARRMSIRRKSMLGPTDEAD